LVRRGKALRNAVLSEDLFNFCVDRGDVHTEIAALAFSAGNSLKAFQA
jgi:hypothetical protein